MRAITPARYVVLELHPETHQWSLDIDFELDGIILKVDVKIAVTDKYLGGDIPHLEVVTQQSDALPGSIYLARIKDTVIATDTEAPAVIETQQGIQADNGRVESDGLAYLQATVQ